MTHRLSFSTLACPRWGWEETARRAAEFGYDGVEIRMIAGDVDLLSRPELSPPRRLESRRIFDDLEIAVCGLASSIRFDQESAAERVSQVDVGRRYLDLARDLGAGFVRVFGDVLPPAKDVRGRQATLGQIAEGLLALGEWARVSTPEVRIVVETHGDFSDSHLMADLMALAPHPSIGVLWDTHHPWRFHGELLEETRQRLGPRIWHTHWKDSHGEEQPSVARESSAEAVAAAERARQLMSGHRDAQYTLFGTGEFPAGECLRGLLRQGYDGWFSLEWEKAWHPELAEPEVALPEFPHRFRAL